MRATRRAALAAVAVAVGLIGGGCGSSDSGTTTHSTSTQQVAARPAAPTRAQYIAQADAVCTRENEQRAPLAREEKALTTQFRAVARSQGENTAEAELLPKLAPLWKREVALYRAGSAQLQALPVPPGDAATIGKIAVAEGDIAADTENVIEAVRQHETLTARTAKEAVQAKVKVRNALEQGYGFQVCGKEE